MSAVSNNPNQPYALIIGEGVHDVAAVIRILKLWQFRELRTLKDLPPFALPMVPGTYPDKDGLLKHLVPHPSFLISGDGKSYVVVSNAGGTSRFGETLLGLLTGNVIDILALLRSVTILADMDNGPAAARQREIQAQLSDAFDTHNPVQVRNFTLGHISVKGVPVPSFLYLFPDNNGVGTLERVLLEGADLSYPDLSVCADAYLSGVNPAKYPLKNFDAEKAKVGVIANALKPGKANQVSISDNDWFTASSLQQANSLHQQFSVFLRQKALAAL